MSALDPRTAQSCLPISFLDPGSNTANARVSKSWSDIAFFVLWCEVHDLWTLGPLKARGRSYARPL
jgi:hypothetical protein